MIALIGHLSAGVPQEAGAGGGEKVRFGAARAHGGCWWADDEWAGVSWSFGVRSWRGSARLYARRGVDRYIVRRVGGTPFYPLCVRGVWCAVYKAGARAPKGGRRIRLRAPAGSK